MRMHIKGGLDPGFNFSNYKGTGIVTGPGSKINAAFKEYIIERKRHKLTAIEIKHNFDDERNPIYGIKPHECIYLFFDANEKEMFRIDATKGDVHAKHRVALTIDICSFLLNIPMSHTVFSINSINESDNEKYVWISPPRKPKLILREDYLKAAKEKTYRSRVKFKKGGFDALHEGMSLEKVIETLNFYYFGELIRRK